MTVQRQVGPDNDFEVATKDVASVVYLCKDEEGCLSSQDWEKFPSQK